jgi:hypothetical protein
MGVGGDGREVVGPNNRLEARLKARERALEAAREAALVGDEDIAG